MHRPITVLVALLLLAVAASPALAARSGSRIAPAGSVQVWLSPVKDDPSICALKVTGKGLKDGQTVYIGRASDWAGLAMDLGVTNGSGTIDRSNTSAIRSDYDNSFTVVVIEDGWDAVLGTDGQQASWSVSNTCKPA